MAEVTFPVSVSLAVIVPDAESTITELSESVVSVESAELSEPVTAASADSLDSVESVESVLSSSVETAVSLESLESLESVESVESVIAASEYEVASTEMLVVGIGSISGVTIGSAPPADEPESEHEHSINKVRTSRRKLTSFTDIILHLLHNTVFSFIYIIFSFESILSRLF